MEICCVLVSGKNDKGNKLVFNDKGLVSQELEGYGASLTDMEQHQKAFKIGRDGGFLLEYIPAGSDHWSR